MQKSDAARVAELAAELGYANDPQSLGARLEAIEQLGDLLLVATDHDDRPIGFIQANRSWVIEVGFRVEIVGLVVSSAARRGGVGKNLIAEVERWAKSAGADVVVVRSNTQRGEAHMFYPAMGFVRAKTQAVYEKHLAG